MANDEFESEEQRLIREDSERKIGAIIQGLPLLGSGNKFVKDEMMSMVVMLAKGRGATNERIAMQMGISVDTLTRHFAVELQNGNDYLDEFIHDGMVMGCHRSIAGNASYNNVLIRMAAHRLGISDKIQQDNTSSDGSMSPTQNYANGLPTAVRLRIENKSANGEGMDGGVSQKPAVALRDAKPPRLPRVKPKPIKKSAKTAKGKPPKPKPKPAQKPAQKGGGK